MNLSTVSPRALKSPFSEAGEASRRRACITAQLVRQQEHGEIQPQTLHQVIDGMMHWAPRVITAGLCSTPQGNDWQAEAIADLRAASDALDSLGNGAHWHDCQVWARVLEAGIGVEVTK